METIQEAFSEKGVSIVPKLFSRYQVEVLSQNIFKSIHCCAKDLGCNTAYYLRNVSRWVDPSPVTQSIHNWVKIFISEILSEIMGQSVELDRMNVISKTPYAHHCIPCHQDIAYSRDHPYEFSLWCALHDVTENDGVMEFLPYSQHEKIAPAIDFWQPNFIDKVALSPAWKKGFINLPVQAGDAILFDSRIWHRSADSYSNNFRFAIVTRWRRSNYQPPTYIPEKIPAYFGMWNCGQLTETLLQKGLEACFGYPLMADLSTYIDTWKNKLKQPEKIPFPLDLKQAEASLNDLRILNQAAALHNGGDAQGIVYPNIWAHLLEPLSKWLNKTQVN
jgi:ectoine hydroxylase-related dioxygenase (phytanoyl-CoA dioxygenase family)